MNLLVYKLSFLQVNKILKSVTSGRGERSFPCKNDALDSLNLGKNKRVFFVYDQKLGGKLLRSRKVKSYNFLSECLNLYGDNDFPNLRKLSLTFPLFQDDLNHKKTRREYNQLIAKCSEKSLSLCTAEIRDIFFKCKHYETVKVNDLASLIAKAAIMSIVQSVCQVNLQALENIDLDRIDFFDPFLTKSKLSRIEEALKILEPNISFDSDPRSVLTATALTMGFRPMKAMLSAYLNDCFSNKQAYSNLGFDSVVPTNFVMRRIASDLSMRYANFEKNKSELKVYFNPGDVVYIFLADSSGCPFSRANSMPFGAGNHICPGKLISERFLEQASLELQRIALSDSSLFDKRIEFASVSTGKSSAFLKYE